MVYALSHVLVALLLRISISVILVQWLAASVVKDVSLFVDISYSGLDVKAQKDISLNCQNLYIYLLD